jgi:pyruvate/2-oxoacid:ferredoxin oxidoreductase alpha subunit
MAQPRTVSASGDLVSRLSAVARIAVRYEQAYDIIDELARMPERYPELFSKLTRVIAKTLSDVERKLNEKKDETLEKAERVLLTWGRLLDEFLRALEDMSEKERDATLRKFAALALAPSAFAIKVERILRG